MNEKKIPQNIEAEQAVLASMFLSKYALQKCVEELTKDYFYLYINPDYAMLVNKNSFEIGTLDDFRKFIKKKCLLKYRKAL